MGWYEEEKIATEIKWAREDMTRELQDLKEAQNRANQQRNRLPSEPLPPNVRKKVFKAGLWIFIGFAALGLISNIVLFIIYLFFIYQ